MKTFTCMKFLEFWNCPFVCADPDNATADWMNFSHYCMAPIASAAFAVVMNKSRASVEMCYINDSCKCVFCL
ncbi:hypothetical protein CW304_26440 [Bacillus sp. UFRGS-B20]|nr:hypothetical protein CW304_26440 [Bacillus sp. UFRGS-B20]